MTVSYFPGRQLVQEYMPNEGQHRREIARTLNLAMKGQTNNSMSVTLDPSVAATVVTDARISLQTCLILQPTTANAAAAIPTTYAVCEAGLATIHHANNAQTDRIFTVSISG